MLLKQNESTEIYGKLYNINTCTSNNNILLAIATPKSTTSPSFAPNKVYSWYYIWFLSCNNDLMAYNL